MTSECKKCPYFTYYESNDSNFCHEANLIINYGKNKVATPTWCPENKQYNGLKPAGCENGVCD